MLKNSKNNGMEEIGVVTPTPGLLWHIYRVNMSQRACNAFNQSKQQRDHYLPLYKQMLTFNSEAYAIFHYFLVTVRSDIEGRITKNIRSVGKL